MKTKYILIAMAIIGGIFGIIAGMIAAYIILNI